MPDITIMLPQRNLYQIPLGLWNCETIPYVRGKFFPSLEGMKFLQFLGNRFAISVGSQFIHSAHKLLP